MRNCKKGPSRSSRTKAYYSRIKNNSEKSGSKRYIKGRRHKGHHENGQNAVGISIE